MSNEGLGRRTLNGSGSSGLWRSLGAGATGAVTLNAVHELARRQLRTAPRMDVIGERGLVKLLRLLGMGAPRGRRLYRSALVGDLVSNALFYAALMLGRNRHPLTRGLLGGAAAGAGGLLLPERLGLGRPPRSRRRDTQAMTIAWYLLGGVAAGLAYRLAARAR